MKCEICHKNDAETVLVISKDGIDEELYVCHACAENERVQRQKKSQRTRKMPDLPPGMSVSMTQFGGPDGEVPPPFVEALMSAMSNAVSDIQRAIPNMADGADADDDESKDDEEESQRQFSCARVDAAYRIKSDLHLEGLSLIGEIPSVQRAFRALGLSLCGRTADGVTNAGHVFYVKYSTMCPYARVKRLVTELIARERDARLQVQKEMPRVLADAVCRALAVLKNCRLVSPGEVFDMMSPLRIAALNGFLDGTTADEITDYMSRISLASNEDRLPMEERDRVDSDRADKINKRFEDVILNEQAEELLK